MMVEETYEADAQSPIQHTQFVPGMRGVECRVAPGLQVDWFVGACPDPLSAIGSRRKGHFAVRRFVPAYPERRRKRSEPCPDPGREPSERRGEPDAHGNAVATVDGQGATWGGVRNVRKFDVWGSQRGDTVKPATPPDHAYCGNLGHTQDDELGGLIYMRARYYEPWTGRFISEDPGRHDSNWYLYARSNAVSSADASGREAGPISALFEFVLRVALTAGIDVPYSAQAIAIIMGALSDVVAYWKAAGALDKVATFSLGAAGSFTTSSAMFVGPGLLAVSVSCRLAAMVARVAILYTAYDMLARLWMISGMGDEYGPWPTLVELGE
jgi:RHS repeat-associated protein